MQQNTSNVPPNFVAARASVPGSHIMLFSKQGYGFKSTAIIWANGRANCVKQRLVRLRYAKRILVDEGLNIRSNQFRITWIPIIVGRMYSEYPRSDGIHDESSRTNS